MATDYDKALNLISIAAKAGKVVSGGFLCEKAIQDGSARIVLIADDASDNTCKRFRDKCTYYDVPYKVIGDKDTLGHRIGKEFRTVIAVTDEGLAKQIAIKLNQTS